MPQHKNLTRQLAAIGTLALATTAWAEAPMATDDAGTLEKGGTKVEGQWSREGQTRGLGLAVAHSPLEKLEAEISFARSTDRSGSPHVSNRITGLALKWVPISIGKTNIGVKVDRSTEKPDNANRARSSSIRGLYTLRMESGHAFHMNLGRSSSTDSAGVSSMATVWSLGAEQEVAESVTLVGDWFGESGTSPGYLLGARWTVKEGMKLSAAFGRSQGQTLGRAFATWEF